MEYILKPRLKINEEIVRAKALRIGLLSTLSRTLLVAEARLSGKIVSFAALFQTIQDKLLTLFFYYTLPVYMLLGIGGVLYQ